MRILACLLVLVLSIAPNSAIARQSRFERSIEQLKAEAAKGDAAAQARLGLFYMSGTVVTKDTTEGLKWCRKAADQDNPDAQLYIGIAYATGTGIRKDLKEAVVWYRKAAEKGVAEAQFNLAYSLGTGEGALKSISESMRWYRSAAEQGLAEAEYNLGYLYFVGADVPRDRQQAAKWFRLSAEQGYAKAQFQMGGCHLLGEGVLKDYVESYKWLNLAAAQGNESAKSALPELEREMTRDQVADAQRLSRDFVPRVSGNGNERRHLEVATGTGFFVTDDGYLVTAYHVISKGNRVTVVSAEGVFEASLVGADRANDIALLKVDSRSHPLPIAPSRQVRLGDTASTIGFPNPTLQGSSPKFARGEIAGLAGAEDDPRHFQISTPIQPGNSGGPLMDDRGNVVGVVVAKLDQLAALNASGQLPENVNYALKSSLLLGFLETMPGVGGHLASPYVEAMELSEVALRTEQATVFVAAY